MTKVELKLNSNVLDVCLPAYIQWSIDNSRKKDAAINGKGSIIDIAPAELWKERIVRLL
jgi:hypothetical protein